MQAGETELTEQAEQARRLPERTPALYFRLFRTCFGISLMAFGGGMVVISTLQEKFVDEYGYVSQDEMMDLIAIAQSCPGVMAVNSSIIVGYHVGGVLGALTTMLGTVLPPMVILSVISFFYREYRDNPLVALVLKGMQAGVAAVLINVTITMCRAVLKDRKLWTFLLLAGAAFASIVLGTDIILLIVVCGILGGTMVWLEEHRGGKTPGGDRQTPGGDRQMPGGDRKTSDGDRKTSDGDRAGSGLNRKTGGE